MTSRNRYLLQGPDGSFFATSANQSGIACTTDPKAAYAFVDVDAAATRAQALIANGIPITRITAISLP